MTSLDGIQAAKVINNKKKFFGTFHPKNYFKFLSTRVWQIVLAIIFASTASVAVFSTNSVQNSVDLFQIFKSGKYLIIFQNNRELRATGGFIGSYATVETDFGKIKSYNIDTNIYKKDDKYNYMLRRVAPDPIQKILGERFWSMHDANWWVDYPQSAREIEWFWESEGEEPVDGVVAINASLVEDLLKITGDIYLPEYNQTVSSENFNFVVQKFIDQDYYQSPNNQQTDEPKIILKDLAPKLLERLATKKYSKELLSLVNAQLKKKNLLFYFNNQSLEKLVLMENWGGEVKKNPQNDYLYVNNSNLGGGKSSLNVTEELRLNSSTNSEGEIYNSLVVTRVHHGDGKWPDCDNINYIRILVPNGAQLTSAKLDDQDVLEDVVVDSEAGKTEFGLWMSTPAKSTKILKISYKLPFRLANKNKYSIYLQKQPGSLDDEVEIISNEKLIFNNSLGSDQELSY